MIDQAYPNGSLTVEPAIWESDVLGVRAVKIKDFIAPSYKDALELLKPIVSRGSFDFISIDCSNLSSYYLVALEDAGFHIGSHYIDYLIEIDDNVLNLMNPYRCRYNIRPMRPSDSGSVSKIASDAFDTGRFMADPHFPNGWGEKLYGAWGENSCKGYASTGVVCLVQDNILGFMTAREKGLARADMDLIAVSKEFVGMGVGASLLAEMVYRLDERFVDSAIARTERCNQEINGMYEFFRFPMINTGIVMHWVKKGLS